MWERRNNSFLEPEARKKSGRSGLELYGLVSTVLMNGRGEERLGYTYKVTTDMVRHSPV